VSCLFVFHRRRFTVSQLLLEAAIDPPVPRPPATPEGWTTPNLESAGMLTLWEAPYLDIGVIGSDVELIRCFWPKRAGLFDMSFILQERGGR
jgi:hypothetical protein